mmetsp:Transcript_47647/g.123536  ORF Transcript_47647/g.123536 Transcript_47647/m.123536 type:complete len:417 (+) Transcript_47647:257-1507(+)
MYVFILPGWQASEQLRLKKAASLTSAASLLGLFPRSLRDMKGCNLLCTRRVNADSVGHVLPSDAHLHGSTKPLHHLTSMGSQEVDTHNAATIISCVGVGANHLAVAVVHWLSWKAPFKGPEKGVVHFDVLFFEVADCLFFTQPAHRVLEGSENSCGSVLIVHQCLAFIIQPACKKLSSLLCDGRQLEHPVYTIANSVDVVDRGLLKLVYNNLAVFRAYFHTNVCGIDLAHISISANCEKYSVVHIALLLSIAILVVYNTFAFLIQLDLGRHRLANEVNTLVFHVGRCQVGHLLVKSSQEDASYHNRGIISKLVEESSTLKRDIGSSNDKGLAGSLRESKHIIRSNAILLCTRDIGVARPSSSCNQELLSSNLLHFSLLVFRLNGVGINKPSIRVHVRHFLVSQLLPVSPVERSDVV